MNFYNQPLKEQFMKTLPTKNYAEASVVFNKTAKIEHMLETDICRMDNYQLKTFFSLLECPSEQRFGMYLNILAAYTDYMYATWQGYNSSSTIRAVGNQIGYNYKANIFNRFLKNPEHLLKAINALYGKPKINGYYIYDSAAIVLIYSGIDFKVVHNVTRNDIDFQTHKVCSCEIPPELWDIIMYSLKSTMIPKRRGLIGDINIEQCDNIIKYNTNDFYDHLRQNLIKLRNELGTNVDIPINLTITTVCQSGVWYRLIQKNKLVDKVDNYKNYDFQSFLKAYYE